MASASFVKTIGLAAAGITAVAGGGVLWWALSSPSAPAYLDTPPPQMRLLSEAQYRNTIEDVFGADISVVGRFEPPVRIEGLAAVGASHASISSIGYERYYTLAQQIAKQVTAEPARETALQCEPNDSATYDAACADEIISRFAELLFRRPIADDEHAQWSQAFQSAVEATDDFYQGAELALGGMLASPEFLFITDALEDTPEGPGKRLSGHSKAVRLSYFLWNTTPDADLLSAAASGALHTEEGLHEQIERMLADERLHDGARAFFTDFLALDSFNTLEKDKLIYPAFNARAADDAREQVLKFLTHQLLDENHPYPAVFTSKETYITRPLGMIYELPVRSPEGWEPLTLAEDDPRAGLLSHIGFTALHSHPGRSSATLRGIAVRELLLCQKVAPAPAAVNFTVVQDTDNPEFKTARARLTQHRTDDACKSCHAFIDPVGLALENLDGVGRFRETENGELIDTSGSIDGLNFADLGTLHHVISEHPATTSCLVEKAQRYATGREPSAGDMQWLLEIERAFENSDYRLKDLFRTIATSERFLSVELPPEPDTHTASRKDEETRS